ncbi:beta-N-acetylhexosaminidase [Peterkaempfera bronchialis]|uniref:beta-N-acetylhexosaminidase n=1 Tax=Peterkaempfera bronchialis TaxID=2126346 RepID=UPI003C2F6D23
MRSRPRLVPAVVAAVAAVLLAADGLAVVTATGAAEPAATPPPGVDRLVPKPVAARATGGTPFTLGAASRIVAPGAARPVGDYLAGLLRRSTGYRLPVTSGTPQSGDIVLEVAAGGAPAGHADEGYTLVTGGETATVRADRPAGLFHGVQTLRQLLPAWVESRRPVGGPWTAQAAVVSDYPRFGYRGVMLDVARSFLTVDEVKHYLDGIAQFKVNTLHLHLTDDQAWRLAVDTPAENPSGLDYTALTSVGSKGGADVRSTDGKPLGTEPGRRGFYTQDDYRDIVSYAGSRFITVVPEIDGPSHTNAALASIPQLNPDGVAKPMNDTGEVGYSTLDTRSPTTYEFLRTVLTQLAALTPGRYLHIGGDEAHVTSHDDYLDYLRRTLPIVGGLGKTAIGWNEYAAADLPAGSLIQYWKGPMAPVLTQVARGAKVIMSPAAITYLDQKYTADTPIGLSWACSGGCDYDHSYDWNPVRDGLREADVAGVEAALWSETVRGIDQADWLGYPRLVSVAEVGWTPQDRRDVRDFTARLAPLGTRLTLQGVDFRPSPGVRWTTDVRAGDSALPGPGALSGGIAWFTAPGAAPDRVAALIDFGDGSAPVAGAVTRERPAGALSAGGVFTVTAPGHRYTRPGTFSGRVTVTTPLGRRSAPFTVTVGPPR